jgi:hypothetical protein
MVVCPFGWLVISQQQTNQTHRQLSIHQNTRFTISSFAGHEPTPLGSIFIHPFPGITQKVVST